MTVLAANQRVAGFDTSADARNATELIKKAVQGKNK
jgi:hypothetical protein